jgi:hypothetical protein
MGQAGHWRSGQWPAVSSCSMCRPGLAAGLLLPGHGRNGERQFPVVGKKALDSIADS